MLAWALAFLGLYVLMLWPLARLIETGSLHAALGTSAVIGVAVLVAWRFAGAWTLSGVSARDAFKDASRTLPSQPWSWRMLPVGMAVVLALTGLVLLSWPGLLQTYARVLAAFGVIGLIAGVHAYNPARRSRDTAAKPVPPAKSRSEKQIASPKSKQRKASKQGLGQKRGFANNAEVVALEDWPTLARPPVEQAAPILPDDRRPDDGPAEPGVPAQTMPESREPVELAPVQVAQEAARSLGEAELAALDERLHDAARTGRVDRALALLHEGARATAKPAPGDKDQRSLVVLAAVLPDLRLLRALIAQGAELNPEDPSQAPLAVATRDSWHGRPEAVATLLANGADARRTDAQGNTALHQAAHSTDPAVAALLLDASSDINAVNNDGVTPLWVAAKSGNWRVAKFLIERGAKLNLDGATPALNAAASCDDDDAAGVELFIKHKAKMDATDLEGRSPLHMAARMGHIGIFQALVDHGMSVAARDGNGRGVIHHAVEGETSADFVQELLHMGARADFEDIEGFTPLKRARANARWALVSVLDPGFKRSSPTEVAQAERVPYAVVSDALASGDRNAAIRAAAGLNTEERVRLFEEHGLSDLELAHWLLANGVPHDAVNREGRSIAGMALLKAAEDDVASAVSQALFARGAQVNGCGLFAAYLKGVMGNAQARASGETLALRWLERGADAFGANEAGESPLHLAIKLKWSALAHALLARGVNPDAQDPQGITPLHVSIIHGDRAMVKALIAAGASPRLRANDGQTAHGLALASGRKDLIEWVDWRLWPTPGRALRAQDLPAAAISGDLHAVLRLLELGFDVNTRDAQGCTALLRAAGGGHMDVIEALLAESADPALAAEAGATPLSAAVSMRNVVVAERLIAAGADIEQRLPGEVTLLMLSAALGLPKMAALLLRYGARVDAVDAQGLTALHCACLFAFNTRDRAAAVTLMDTLLLAGARPDPAETTAIAPVLLLLGARAEPGASTDETVILSVLDQFIAEGVSLQSKDARGFGPLHVAALHGLMRVIKMLLRAGANPDARDGLNRTAREVALMRGFVDVATELGTGEGSPQMSMANFLRTPNTPRQE